MRATRESTRPEREGARRAVLGAVVLPLLLVLVAAPAAGDSGDRPSEGEPSFLIETITVENADRFSEQIVVSESLLEEGRTYTEDQLRDAIHRVKRLPLILDAEFALKRGSLRGRYELSIRVVETRRWFFGLDLEATLWSDPISVTGLETTDGTIGSQGVIGRRFRAGRYGVVYLGAGGTDGSIQAGFTRYNLFARGAVASISGGFSGCANARAEDSTSDPGDDGCRTEIPGLGLDPTLATWSITGNNHRVRFGLDLPLGGNQLLQVSSSVRHTASGLRRQAFEPPPGRYDLFTDRSEVDLTVAWVSNSLDDPLFPTRGRRLEAGLDVRSLTADLESVGLGGGEVRRLSWRSFQVGAVLSAARYWPRNGDNTLWARGQFFLGRSAIEDVPTADGRVLDDVLGVWNVAAAVGHARLLRRRRTDFRTTDSRWEAELEAFVHGTSPSYGLLDNPRVGLEVGTGWTWRNGWGVLRLRLSYVHGWRSR